MILKVGRSFIQISYLRQPAFEPSKLWFAVLVGWLEKVNIHILPNGALIVIYYGRKWKITKKTNPSKCFSCLFLFLLRALFYWPSATPATPPTDQGLVFSVSELTSGKVTRAGVKAFRHARTKNPWSKQPKWWVKLNSWKKLKATFFRTIHIYIYIICNKLNYIHKSIYIYIPFLSLSPIIMEVENCTKWKETNIGGTHFPLPWLWEEEYISTKKIERISIPRKRETIFIKGKMNHRIISMGIFKLRVVRFWGK